MAKAKLAWKNYNRTTPQLYLRIGKLARRILLGLATGSVLLKNEAWISVILIILVPSIEEGIQFISDESEEANTIHVESEADKSNIVLDPPKT